jgi:hypothetical protein
LVGDAIDVECLAVAGGLCCSCLFQTPLHQLIKSASSPQLFPVSIFVTINNSASCRFPTTDSQLDNTIKMSGKGYSYKSSGTNSDVSIAIA